MFRMAQLVLMGDNESKRMAAEISTKLLYHVDSNRPQPATRDLANELRMGWN